jgi:hypothetical protein
MAERNPIQSDETRTQDEDAMRASNPQNARQDPENLERQRQVERDRDALQAQAERVEATAPAEAREQTIGEMTEDAERRAERDRQR